MQSSSALTGSSSANPSATSPTSPTDPVAKIQRQRSRLLRALQDLDLVEQRLATDETNPSPTRRRSLSTPVPPSALHYPANGLDDPDVMLPHPARVSDYVPESNADVSVGLRDLDADIEDLMTGGSDEEGAVELDRLADELSGGDYDILGEDDETEWKWNGGEVVGDGVRRRKG
ncbi:hypothetical protein HK097_008625 [Rhizophlyctis rosea]|uniref:Uncharacterized protein n=1 Tax=Rhizophlyctis rosea TaxID=64517 RepID=A0AAD5X3U1_9FUNG|nr:hypothetical protein HK097_008625 [Rhizophlyctis rosea]